MKRTIIFLSGFMVPNILAKTRFVWDDSIWKDYHRIYMPSKTPTSDYMVAKELDRLSGIVNAYPNVTFAGQSLGAWWGANLACRPESKIKKLALWIPLGDAQAYPIFNASRTYHPPHLIPNQNSIGPHRTIVYYGKRDFIVPPKNHCFDLIKLFNAESYPLDGGHFFQINHKAGLNFMKDWIEID
jgi:pimeloyl-ACP methyl ester carboxylesterase